MKESKGSNQYADEEAQQRFEAALRGSRKVGPKPMKVVDSKRVDKSKVSTRKKMTKP